MKEKGTQKIKINKIKKPYKTYVEAGLFQHPSFQRHIIVFRAPDLQIPSVQPKFLLLLLSIY